MADIVAVFLHAGGDGADAVFYRFGAVVNIVQVGADVLCHLYAMVNRYRQLFAVADRIFNIQINLTNGITNLLCGIGGFGGQRAYLIRNNCKAASLFACPCGFNGSIKRQQVGLFGNVTDHAGDGFNFF